MIIGIISDTHDNVRNVIKAVEIFRKERCEMILHLGDVISPATLNFFKDLRNFKFIRGNCDGDIPKMKEIAEKLGMEYLGESAKMELGGKKFLLVHRYPDVMPAEELQRYDYILHGHDHKKKNMKIGKARIINPGAHYYMAENTIAILDTKDDNVGFIEIR